MSDDLKKISIAVSRNAYLIETELKEKIPLYGKVKTSYAGFCTSGEGNFFFS